MVCLCFCNFFVIFLGSLDAQKQLIFFKKSFHNVCPLNLLKNKETNVVRLLLRAEPRGHVALNRAVLPNMEYKSQEKYVKVTTSNEKGDGLEMWMIQTKTKDLAEALAGAMEEHKKLNEK